MHPIRWRSPSPAMVVALLALFVALGGSGYAATQIQQNGSDAAAAKKKNKKNKKKHPSHGIRGPKGDPGPRGLQGLAGPQGPAGTARAFAHITKGGTATPTLDAANSVNIAQANITTVPVTTGITAICIQGLSFSPRNVSATVDYAMSHSVNDTVVADIGAGNGVCPGGTQVEILTAGTGPGAVAQFNNDGVYLTLN